MHYFFRPCALLAGALFCSAAAHADETLAQRSERLETAAVERLLGDGMCPGAVAAIKSGLAAKKPYIMLLAGNMYEEGLCVKPDWDKAAGLYMRAEEAGQRFAIERLAAGYARPGRDNGMAIWWAARTARRAYPARCIPAADPLKDPDGFNLALERMPPATFQSCVYLIGVVNELLSQIRYPQVALRYNVTGTFRMAFVPAAGTISWTVEQLDVDETTSPNTFYRNLANEELNNPRAIRNSLIDYLNAKSKFALARYPRPAGDFAPDFVFTCQYGFRIDKW